MVKVVRRRGALAAWSGDGSLATSRVTGTGEAEIQHAHHHLQRRDESNDGIGFHAEQVYLQRCGD